MDDRHGSASTVMVSQLPVDQWYVTVGYNTLADALLDRLALKGESMRKKRVQLTEREHLRLNAMVLTHPSGPTVPASRVPSNNCDHTRAL